MFQITKRNKMKTSVRNIITSLFIGTAAFTATAEEITTGAVVNANSQEVITYTVHHATCANASNGSIDIEVTNGSTYFFSWDNGMNAEDISGLSAGTYRVKIETNEGEVLFASFEVTAPAVLEAMITQDNLHTTASLDLFVQGGTAPYTYEWNTGETTEDLAGVSTEGIYEVNVTDANGCQLNIGTYVALESAAGLISEAAAFTFKVYPNPSLGDVNLTWDGVVFEKIEMYKSTGSFMEAYDVNLTNNLSLEGLKSGMYLFKAYYEDQVVIRKLIVK